MEINIKDLKELKISPSLVCLLKCIHNKDDRYLEELHAVADIFAMGRHLQNKGFVKIIDDKLSCESFEIRKLSIINYLSNENTTGVKKEDIDEVINYFKLITGKNRISSKSSSNRSHISARLSEYSVQDLKDVIDLKYKQWKDNPNMRKYIRIETIFNQTKFQSYIGELDDEEIVTKDFNDDI